MTTEPAGFAATSETALNRWPSLPNALTEVRPAMNGEHENARAVDACAAEKDERAVHERDQRRLRPVLTLHEVARNVKCASMGLSTESLRPFI